MTIFDLLFLLLAFLSLGTLGAALVAALRGQWPQLRRICVRIVGGAAVYFAAVAVVSVASPQRFLSLGDPQCSDDWCIAVVGAHRDTLADGVRYAVTFRVSSRARRVTQRERFVVAYLRDAAGRRYDAAPAPSDPPFDVALGPLQSVDTRRVFPVPATARGLGVVIAREGGFNFPGCCIIGDESSLLHKRTVVRLDATS